MALAGHMQAEQAEALATDRPSGCAASGATGIWTAMMLRGTYDDHHDAAQQGNGVAVAAFAGACAVVCALVECPADLLEDAVEVGADVAKAGLPANYAVERRRWLKEALTQTDPCMI